MITAVSETNNTIFWQDEKGEWQNAKIDDLIKLQMKESKEGRYKDDEFQYTYFYYDRTETLACHPLERIDRMVYRCGFCKQRVDGMQLDISKMRYCPYCGKKVTEFKK